MEEGLQAVLVPQDFPRECGPGAPYQHDHSLTRVQILLFLAALCLAALGIYAGVEDAIAAFADSTATAFSCIAPGQPTS